MSGWSDNQPADSYRAEMRSSFHMQRVFATALCFLLLIPWCAGASPKLLRGSKTTAPPSMKRFRSGSMQWSLSTITRTRCFRRPTEKRIASTTRCPWITWIRRRIRWDGARTILSLRMPGPTFGDSTQLCRSIKPVRHASTRRASECVRARAPITQSGCSIKRISALCSRIASRWERVWRGRASSGCRMWIVCSFRWITAGLPAGRRTGALSFRWKTNSARDISGNPVCPRPPRLFPTTFARLSRRRWSGRRRAARLR